MEDFRARMDNLSPLNNLEFVGISVVENFLCDKLGISPEPESFDDKVGKVCIDFCDVVIDSAKKNPSTVFVVAKPTHRPRFRWFEDSHEEFSNFIAVKLKSNKLKNVRLIECIPDAEQKFQLDATHFELLAGKSFVSGMIWAGAKCVEELQMSLGLGHEEEEDSKPDLSDMENGNYWPCFIVNDYDETSSSEVTMFGNITLSGATPNPPYTCKYS